MRFLAVKYKHDSYLWVQSRSEREFQLHLKMLREEEVDTIVIKAFKRWDDALIYCTKINLITDLLKTVL